MITELQTAISNVPKRKTRLDGLTKVESVRITVERAALLFRGAPIAIGVSLANALVTLAVAGSDIGQGLLVIWTATLVGLSTIRIAVWLRFRTIGVSARNMARFARLHIFFMALNGACWGALAPLFAVHGMLDHAFLPFVIAGTAAAAIVSAGASWRAVLAFNIPALVPLSAVYGFMGGPDGLAIAGIVLLYGLATAYLALATQRMIDRSILLHSKNEKLLSALHRQVDEAHETEQRFRALVESSLDVTLIFTPSGTISYASPSVSKTLGVAPEKLLGMTTKDLVHPDDISLFRSVGEKALSQLGEVIPLSHVCMRAGEEGDYIAFGGRLTNMLYVPGVEGFVFSGGALPEQEREGDPHRSLELSV